MLSRSNDVYLGNPLSHWPGFPPSFLIGSNWCFSSFGAGFLSDFIDPRLSLFRRAPLAERTVKQSMRPLHQVRLSFSSAALLCSHALFCKVWAEQHPSKWSFALRSSYQQVERSVPLVEITCSTVIRYTHPPDAFGTAGGSNSNVRLCG